MPPDSLLPATSRALLHRLATEQTDCRVPSLVAGVLRDGDLAWTAGRGDVDGQPADADTQYRIGSISKTFVGVLVMRLRDEGLLRLDDPLDEYLPGTPVGDRTIVHLLTHDSGLQSEVPGPWWERSTGRDWATLAASLRADSVKHPAGRRHHYSNPGTALLGRVVEKLRGRSWFDALTDEVLVPLGLRRTTYHPTGRHAQGYAVHPYADVVLREPHTDTQTMAPAGQLWSTVHDLATWCRFLGGDTGGVLDPATLDEMRQPVTLEDAGDAEWNSAYGLCLEVFASRGRRMVGHGGSMPGFLATVLVDVADDVGVVTMANTTSGLSGALPLDLLDLLTELEPPLPRVWRPTEVSAELLDLVGHWYRGPRAYVLHARPDGWLDLTEGTESRCRFRPVGGDTWIGLDGYHAGETLRVVRDGDGSPRQLDVGTFCFTRTPYDPAASIPGGLDSDGWHAGPP